MAVEHIYAKARNALQNSKNAADLTRRSNAISRKKYTTLWRKKSLDRLKIKGYINIAHKAGYLICGGEKLDGYTKKLYLVLYDNTAGENTLKIVERFDEQVKKISVDNLEDLASIKNCKIIGIKNKNLSEIIEKLIQG